MHKRKELVVTAGELQYFDDDNKGFTCIDCKINTRMFMTNLVVS